MSHACTQECPNSGLLLSESIFMAPKATRRAKSTDAVQRAGDDPLVLLAVARLFASERKGAKARAWFVRTVKLGEWVGCIYIYIYIYTYIYICVCV